MPVSIVTKFQEDRGKNVWLRERKHLATRLPIHHGCLH